MKLNVVYEDNDVIVVNKPAGLTVHKGVRTGETLVDLLVDHYPDIKLVGDDPARPGIVHRLDKDTSGLMVVAKNNEVFNFLKKQFQERKIEKKYIVLARGHTKDKRGLIIGKIGRLGDMQVVAASNDNLKIKNLREAETEYRVLKYFNDYTLIEARPKTGRMHQIRVHFKSIGHPVAGDKKYGFRKCKTDECFSRQFLHAAYLSFILPNGGKMAFEADLPEDLQNILLNIEKNGN